MVSLTADVCVVGGGPAGAALAIRLAQLGRRVVVVEKAGFPRPHLGESLTAGVRPLLELLGMQAAIDAGGFIASPGATAAWAGEQRHYRVPGGSGLQVDRARFDALLLGRAAVMPGVTVCQPAVPVDREWTDGEWRVRLDTGAVIRARYLADAAGRSRFLPGAKRAIGAATLALCAYWTDTAKGEDSDTLIEAGPAGWFWGAPVPGGLFNATVFVDAGPVADYEQLISCSRLLRPRLERAVRQSEIRVCDATAYEDLSPVTFCSIKVGDAALSIDPLSSQGVQAAIGTAVHAAVVLNTMCERPGDTELAMGFYRSRLRHAASYHAAAAASQYGRHLAAGGGEFWRRRATPVPLEPPRASLSPTAVVHVPAAVQFDRVAVAVADRVAGMGGVRAHGRDYAFVNGDVPIAPLLREIDGPMAATDVVRRWSRTMHASDAFRILAWAWSERLVDSPAVA